MAKNNAVETTFSILGGIALTALALVGAVAESEEKTKVFNLVDSKYKSLGGKFSVLGKYTVKKYGQAAVISTDYDAQIIDNIYGLSGDGANALRRLLNEGNGEIVVTR